MEQSEQDLPLWARLKQQRLNKEQSARAAKEVARTEKEAARVERKKKQLAKLEQLHPDICETTHPRATHAQWANVVKRRGVKFKSTTTTANCLNCKEKIPVRGKSWVMSKTSKNAISRGYRKKTKIHLCERCGISPKDIRPELTTRKIVDPPSPSYFRSPGRVRLYSGQRKN